MQQRAQCLLRRSVQFEQRYHDARSVVRTTCDAGMRTSPEPPIVRRAEQVQVGKPRVGQGAFGGIVCAPTRGEQRFELVAMRERQRLAIRRHRVTGDRTRMQRRVQYATSRSPGFGPSAGSPAKH